MVGFSDVASLKEFLRRKGKSNYSEILDNLPNGEVRRLVDTLNAIELDYDSKRFRTEQEKTVTAFSIRLDELLRRCAPIRFTYLHRLKSSDSLLLKILTNYLDEKSDYMQIDAENYYKIVTDLTGFKVLYRYPQEWRVIDAHLRSGKMDDNTETGYPLFVDNTENYITNRIRDYCGDLNRPSFIVEQPIWYYLNTKQVKLVADTSLADFIGYEHIDTLPSGVECLFQRIPSPQGYRSLHYLINMNGKYVELQVRTLFDEAWAECNHDLVYKFLGHDNNVVERKEFLNVYSLTLAHQMGVGRDIAEKMYGMLGSNQENDEIQIDLHTIISRQIRVVGDLNGRVANLIKRQRDDSLKLTESIVASELISAESIIVGDWVKNNM